MSRIVRIPVKDFSDDAAPSDGPRSEIPEFMLVKLGAPGVRQAIIDLLKQMGNPEPLELFYPSDIGRDLSVTEWFDSDNEPMRNKLTMTDAFSLVDERIAHGIAHSPKGPTAAAAAAAAAPPPAATPAAAVVPAPAPALAAPPPAVRIQPPSQLPAVPKKTVDGQTTTPRKEAQDDCRIIGVIDKVMPSPKIVDAKKEEDHIVPSSSDISRTSSISSITSLVDEQERISRQDAANGVPTTIRSASSDSHFTVVRRPDPRHPPTLTEITNAFHSKPQYEYHWVPVGSEGSSRSSSLESTSRAPAHNMQQLYLPPPSPSTAPLPSPKKGILKNANAVSTNIAPPAAAEQKKPVTSDAIKMPSQGVGSDSTARVGGKRKDDSTRPDSTLKKAKNGIDGNNKLSPNSGVGATDFVERMLETAKRYPPFVVPRQGVPMYNISRPATQLPTALKSSQAPSAATFAKGAKTASSTAFDVNSLMSLPIQAKKATEVPENKKTNAISLKPTDPRKRKAIQERERLAKEAYIEKALSEPRPELAAKMEQLILLKKQQEEEARKNSAAATPAPSPASSAMSTPSSTLGRSRQSSSAWDDDYEQAEGTPKKKKAAKAGEEKAKVDKGPPITCGLCGDSELTNHTLDRQKVRYHVLNHCPIKAYQCAFCDHCGFEPGKIKRHYSGTHKVQDKVVGYDNELLSGAYDVYMKRCFPNYNTGKLRIGRRINYPNHNEPKYACIICHASSYKSLNAYHIVDKHADIGIYNCDQCKYKTVIKRSLVCHKQASHGVDCGMDVVASEIDYTEDQTTTLTMMKSFFPSRISTNDPKLEPVFKRMFEVQHPKFDKDKHMRELFAAQDGLVDKLNHNVEAMVCVICIENGTRTVVGNIYDMVLHSKTHVTSKDCFQWQCPEGGCPFASNNKLDVDFHLNDLHPMNDFDVINRWHLNLRVYRELFQKCFPGHRFPVSSLRPDPRARPVLPPIKEDLDFKMDVSGLKQE